MRGILAIFRALLVIVNTAWQILILSVMSLSRGRNTGRGYAHRRIWARNAMRILGIRLVEVQGKIDVPIALIVSNHRSLLDPVIQLAYIDAHIIAKDTVGRLPVIGKGAQMTGILLVKREKLRSRVAARNATKELLEQGTSVLVYPEGTTSINQITDTFKPGTFAIASQLKIPVIPVAIEYPSPEDFWTSGGMGAQIIRQTGKWRTQAKLRIGPPHTGSDAKVLMEDCRAWIDNNLVHMQKEWSQMFPS